MTRFRLLVLLVTTVLVVAAGRPAFSTAAFTSTTTHAPSTVVAAPDWTPPTVSLRAPAVPSQNSVTLTADAADGETGVASVTIEFLPVNGSAWTTVCTVTTAPYSCAWDTTKVGDDGYSLRARATDRAGYSAVSDTVRTTVANKLLVVLAEPGDIVRGTVALSATLYNATGGVTYAVRIEYAPAGTTGWKAVCPSRTSAPYTCAWNTTSGVSNDEYDLRAVALAGNTVVATSDVVPNVLVDNELPKVTMSDPGTPLSGTRTFQATATDDVSGIATVTLQAQPAGGAWTDLCTRTAVPYSCRFDTTTLTDGTYSFRAVATDAAGNVTSSAAVTNRVVDNKVSSVSLEDPGAFLTGTVTLRAAASSTAGVRSVTIQRAPAGTTTWTDVCTAATAPYTCAWSTVGVTNGLYDLRAVLVDGTGATTTSATVAGRQVDNLPLRGLDIQATNGGPAAGRLDAGDTITYTFSQQVNPATILAGWTGGGVDVTLRLRDGNLLGLGNSGDTIDIQLAGSTVNLGSVVLNGDYLKKNTATATARMTATTVTVNGTARTVVTVVLLATPSPSGQLRTPTTGAHMVWTPSAAVQSLAGVSSSTAPVTETGTLDKDF
ncbi:hypothetical protein ATJ97_0753 [Georgenia soli]|uniref:Signal peptidase I n=1 Tax=Georgenia soli TaxID=638953 RepID=A0A2A9EJ53_9MICO|nr:Ig-like domain-containing protein [Georgenia soli]PFG38280.1 hypothetical protein ATJ97_0753 [Georgenia soli]